MSLDTQEISPIISESVSDRFRNDGESFLFVIFLLDISDHKFDDLHAEILGFHDSECNCSSLHVCSKQGV